ncbi:hypothetical protein FB446DRAFT_747585 [Lentinula raphanica]|nr:hypothetical protein FB446DRAFT_747585 [Lentinula raphanica]
MVHSSHHLIFVLVTFLAAVGNITQVVAVPVGALDESGTQQVASSSDSSSPPDASTVYQIYAKHPCASFGVILCLEARKVEEAVRLLPSTVQLEETFLKEDVAARLEVIRNSKFLQHSDRFREHFEELEGKFNSSTMSPHDLVSLELMEVKVRLDNAGLSPYKPSSELQEEMLKTMPSRGTRRKKWQK